MRAKLLWLSGLIPGIVLYGLALKSGINLEASSSKLEIVRAATAVGYGMFSLALLRTAVKTGLGELVPQPNVSTWWTLIGVAAILHDIGKPEYPTLF